MNENDKSEDLSQESPEGEISWSFCPRCGEKLPKVKKIKYCTNCGLDFEYLREHKEIPPSEYEFEPGYYPEESYETYYSQEQVKIEEDQIEEARNTKLWSTFTSILLPLGAFIAMNAFLIVAVLGVIFLIGSLNLDFLMDLMSSPWFLIISSLAEYLFIIIPIVFVGRYLKKPTWNNRFKLLGFSIDKFDQKGLMKEISLGLAFGIGGIFIVAITSTITELILEIAFGINIVQESTSTGEVDIYITGATFLELIFLSLIMILVVGPSEEIIFRGFMQRGLINNLGKTTGIIITALIFGSIHLLGIFMVLLISPIEFLINFIYLFFPYLSISLLLGYLCYWREGNLIAVTILHGVYNAFTVVLAFLAYNAPMSGIIIFISLISVIMAVCFFLYYFLEKS
ncbi:MAG: CAAX amino terminal protease self-immunity [Promethearchaeota archaeon]|nr:MAG: CAAX amino terminal protease self-immunity [Candidatus Lokiarchaeota archaeon]